MEEYQQRIENSEFKNTVPISSEIPTNKKKEKTKSIFKKLNFEKMSKLKKDIEHKRKIKKVSEIIQKNVSSKLRYTEGKKRNLLSRIILQERLAKGRYDDLEQDIEEGYITQDDVNASKLGKKWSEKRLYKQVQAYEDAKGDVSVRKGWKKFKFSLAGVALAGVIALSTYAYNEIKNSLEDLETANRIVSIQELDEHERSIFETKAQKVRREIIEKDGYYFNSISEDEFNDGFYRILSYEKKMNEYELKNTIHNFTKDGNQQLLDKIVKESFEGEYADFSEDKKRDYKQLAFELFSYSHPEEKYYIRNPMVMEQLSLEKDLKKRGYQMELIVSGDENIRYLGNIRNEIQNLTEINYNSYKHSQKEFFEDILESVFGEKLENLKDKEKRDYIQIIYELLPDNAKKHIKDPIEMEKKDNITYKQINYMEIGD